MDKIAKGIKGMIDTLNKEHYSKLILGKTVGEWHKEAAEKIFKVIRDSNYTPTEIEFFDHYYIFGKGENGVVNFKLAEAPEWKFGIWFEIWETSSKDPGGNRKVSFSLFTQYEETLDKFKPTRASYKVEETYILSQDKGLYSDSEEYVSSLIKEMLDYIVEHKELAYYRDQYMVDFNTHYVPEEKAKKIYLKDKRDREEADRLTKLADETYLTRFRNIIATSFQNFEIVDKGESWHPRYDLVVSIDDNPKIAKSLEGVGCYSLHDILPKYKMASLSSLENKLKKKVDKCEQAYWWKPIDNFLTFTTKDRLNKYHREMEKENETCKAKTEE